VKTFKSQTRRRIIFSIALFPIAATALSFFRLTKSRRNFYAQIECLCFHTASVESRPSPTLWSNARLRRFQTFTSRQLKPDSRATH
jgi:hypothetical protein